MLDKHFKILLFDIAYLGRPMLVGKALSFTHELPYSFFINPPFSAATYFRGSVVDKALTIHQPSLNFHREGGLCEI